jgi:hypothetical protein
VIGYVLYFQLAAANGLLGLFCSVSPVDNWCADLWHMLNHVPHNLEK